MILKSNIKVVFYYPFALLVLKNNVTEPAILLFIPSDKFLRPRDFSSSRTGIYIIPFSFLPIAFIWSFTHTRKNFLPSLP